MPITRFGSFNFEQPHLFMGKYSASMSQKRPMNSELLYHNGVFRQTGVNNTPLGGGSIQQSISIFSSDPAQMDTYRDQLNAILNYGLVELYFQPSDPEEYERFTYAECTAIKMERDYENNPDLIQRVTLTFDVPNPIWQIIPRTLGAQWGEPWGSSSWAEVADEVIIPVAGLSTDETISYAGNAPSRVKITVSCGSGQTASDVTVKRIVGGNPRDTVTFWDTLVAGDTVVIDAPALSVTKNDVAAYTSIDYLHPRWLELQPGDNLIRIEMYDSGDAATVTIQYGTKYYG